MPTLTTPPNTPSKGITYGCKSEPRTKHTCGEHKIEHMCGCKHEHRIEHLCRIEHICGCKCEHRIDQMCGCKHEQRIDHICGCKHEHQIEHMCGCKREHRCISRRCRHQFKTTSMC